MNSLSKHSSQSKPAVAAAGEEAVINSKSSSEAVISDKDTVNEMLTKLRGSGNKDDEDTQEISEELENAFPSLNLSSQCWDLSEGTRI